MCAASAITDYYKTQWPVQNLNGVWITRTEYEHYQALKIKMQEYDVLTKQPHCEKPDVKDWEFAIEKILKKRGII